MRTHRKCGTGFRIGSMRIEVTALLTAEHAEIAEGSQKFVSFGVLRVLGGEVFCVFSFQFLVLSWRSHEFANGCGD